MSDAAFELEYVDRVTGETVYVEVFGFQRVRELAKELAKASGRRTMIRRKKAWHWSLHLANLETGEFSRIRRGLTKREALLRLRYWKVRKTNCVVIAWPEWVPLRLGLKAA